MSLEGCQCPKALMFRENQKETMGREVITMDDETNTKGLTSIEI
jgi:hypothetical protein